MQGTLFNDDGQAAIPHGVLNRNQTYRDTLPKHGSQKWRVYQHIVKMADVGATRDEIAVALSLPLASVCGRVSELISSVDGQPSLCVETSVRRQTRAGQRGVVIVAKPS
jgi:hypothetical protein